MDSTVAKHGEKTLGQYLTDKPAVGVFKSGPRYFEAGDYLTIFFHDDPCYAERIDELLTVYSATCTGKLVGFKIKGVTELLKHVSSLIGIEMESVAVNLLLLSAIGASPSQRKYYEIGKKARGFVLPKSELPAMA